MARFCTEEQVIEAARRAYRVHAEIDDKGFQQAQREGCTLAQWTDPDAELDTLGDFFMTELASIREA